jgi:hypothetical protein
MMVMTKPELDAMLYIQRQNQILDAALRAITSIAVPPGEKYRDALREAQRIAEEARREAGMLPQ